MPALVGSLAKRQHDSSGPGRDMVGSTTDSSWLRALRIVPQVVSHALLPTAVCAL